jgi:hypothetical protein
MEGMIVLGGLVTMAALPHLINYWQGNPLTKGDVKRAEEWIRASDYDTPGYPSVNWYNNL